MAAIVKEGVLQAFEIVKEEEIAAPIEIVFETILEQMGPLNSTPEKPMPMVLEAWPGGRWYRDLSNGTGHFWGTVQAIKAAIAARNFGAALYVQPRRFEPSISADRRTRHYAHALRAPCHRLGWGAGAWCRSRLEPVDGTHPLGSRENGQGGSHVSFLHGNRDMDSDGCCLDRRSFRTRRRKDLEQENARARTRRKQ